MAWLIFGAAVAVDGLVAWFLRREVPRWREDGSFALVAPLRLLIGALLMTLILLLGVGVAFVLPKPESGTPPSAEMVAYWVFITLLVGAIMLLTFIDVALVRRVFQRRQDEVFADILLGRGQPRGTHAEEPPARDGESGNRAGE